MKNSVSPWRLRLERFFHKLGIGMRAKLIGLFIVIKVLPLVLLALLAWNQSWELGEELKLRTEEITRKANEALSQTGDIAVNDAKTALDNRATEDIERMTTDTAARVANFLYRRDDDLLIAASFTPEERAYREFIDLRRGNLIVPGKWALGPDKKAWVRAEPLPQPEIHTSSIEENDHSFNYRPPESSVYESRPLYLEMTFVDLAGMERIKVTTSPLMDPKLKDVSKRENTFIKAETYFAELAGLKPGEIYVSDVIGEYVGSRVIGTYTPEKAEAAGVEFTPENSAYAGKENPVGKRFKGLVRWAAPVAQDGKVVGYVTLALDHDHIMEFTDHITPAKKRYTELPDASEGNYAFIWDHKGRSICHPRHFSIAGYDAATGDPQVPWLEDRIYDAWQASGKSYAEFIVDEPTFVAQSNFKRPAKELTRQGLVGLDCRYLNFAPQCTGWFDLTQDGGSGSFLILWSGLWKLNTAAAIPYYTGQYAKSKRGFGFVAIGAGVEDFHRPATETGVVINNLINDTDKELKRIADDTYNAIGRNLIETAYGLSFSTGVMCVVVILIAVWLASAFTRSITRLVNGISRFHSGERHFRFNAPIKDELGALADSFDDMADSLVNSVKGPLVITDPERNILYINEPGLNLEGRRLEEVLSRPYAGISIFPKHTRFDPIESFLGGREADVFFHEKTGRYYKGTASYLMDKDGEIVGFVINSNDVTDIIMGQKKLEEQRALLDTIFSSSPDLIWYKDAQGYYLAANPRFASAVGRPVNMLIGACLADVFSSDVARAAEKKDATALKSGKPLYTEDRMTFADGHTEILDTVRTPLFDAEGAPVGILGVARDVSVRVAAEEDLRNTQIELKNAVGAANRANESKSDFLARMSHEIRTPMNAIIGMTNIIKRKIGQPEPLLSDIQAHVLQIETSSAHLLGLLNDILDISKIEAGKIELFSESFDLPRLLSGVEAIIRPRCVEKNIDFNVSVLGVEQSVFISDALRLRQVLINLLGNAVKFTPECGKIVFLVRQEAREEGEALLLFSVADSGIGISEQAARKLFTPFEQGNGKINARYGGTGLGLSISQSIVRLLGGDISVRSKEGEGSEFSFSIRLKEDAPAADERATSADSSVLRGKRALLVDDVDINRIIVVEQLMDIGMAVEEAVDGIAAVEAFERSAVGYYDIILMDVQMPNMDGYAASTHIREMKRPDAAAVPIIAMTANAFKEDVEKAVTHGMNGHLAKPIEYDKFMALLVRFLGV